MFHLIPPLPRIAFIHCPTFSFESYQPEVLKRRGYYAYPPRALQCLQAAIPEIPSRIIDLNFLLLERLQTQTGDLYEMLLQILDENIGGSNVFGVSTGVIVPAIFHSDRHPFLEVLKHLQGRGLIMAGGACATIEARNLIEGRWAHIVFKGEAEDKLRYLFCDGPPTAGIAYWDEGYKETKGSTEMVQFTESLIPTYSYPIEKYHKVGSLSPFSRMAGIDEPYCTIQLIRGCRMKCTFCGLSQYRGSNKVCEYPHHALFEEIRYLATERGIRHFSWLDEDLLAGIEEVKSILREIISHDLKITWSAPTGLITVYIDEELLDLMAESGCMGFRVGIESGNPEMLRTIRKPGNVSGFRRISKLLARYPQFYTVGLYMLGFEGERYGQMFDTFDFTREMNLSWSHFSVYQEIGETDLKSKSLQDYRDWLPSPQKIIGASQSKASGVRLKGSEVFDLPKNEIHSPALKQEIWFAFNLVSNYLCNKHLTSGVNVDHFIRWIESLKSSYPDHPVMSLFLALAYSMQGDKRADTEFERMESQLEQSEYWQSRFKDYELMRLVNDYPVSNVPQALKEVYASLNQRGI